MADSNRGLINYASRDYNSLMDEFWALVPKLTDLWKPEADSEYSKEELRTILDNYLTKVEAMRDLHYLVYVHILPDNRAYVGMTGTSMQDRAGCNGNMYRYCELFDAANSFGGWDNIAHYVLAQGLSYQDALNVEEAFTKMFEAAGYNMINKKCGLKGFKHSDETKRILSEASLGRKLSEETKQKLHNLHAGKPKSAEAIEKQRNSLKAYYTDEQRAKHRELCLEGNRARQCGRPLSDDTKHKISSTLKGRQMSDDWKAKIATSLLGNVPKNAKKVVATLSDGTILSFESSAACDRYFHKYSGWSGEHIRNNTAAGDNIQLRYMEAV